MKVLLFDIENQVQKDLVDSAYDLVKETREFDINNPEPSKFHCISRQPDYHVEITLKDEGYASAKCHCPLFKKTGKCKHAVASLLLVRDYLKQNRKSYKKENKEILDEVLRKLNPGELRSFISSYAMSHSTLRAEIMSNYLYRTRKPDYQHLFHDLAPIDKFGQIKINRNNIKSVRSVSSTLLKRAQQLLLDQSPAEALSILEAVLTHLHKLYYKVTQFQEQLLVELRFVYRLFELLCSQPMAPRLQQRAINLSLELCSRESYVFPSGMNPLLYTTEKFILEGKQRKEAFAIAEHKAMSDSTQNHKWIALLYHWMRSWEINVTNKNLQKKMEAALPFVIRDFSQQGDHEDVLFTASRFDKTRFDATSVRSVLQAGFRAAKLLGAKERMITYASELAMHYLDTDAWYILFEQEKSRAFQILKVIEDLYTPGSDPEADKFLLSSWSIIGDGHAMLKRLRSAGNLELLMLFDFLLKDKFRAELVAVYAGYIHAIRETYGGIMGRQKLNNIFNHLKSLDLHSSVADKIKVMEKRGRAKNGNQKIKGFVFDLDGVIVDTAIHHFQSWKKILKELGADITEEDDHHTRGAGRMESLDFLLDKYLIRLSMEDKLEWASKKNDVYLEAINSITPADLLPGALEFLEESRNMGLLIALGSASKNAGLVLQKLGVRNRFDAIIDGNDTKASKPDPEIFIKAAAALGLEPASVVVFEDAPKGIQAALSAGCKAVGIGEPSNLSEAHIVVPGLDTFSPSQIIEQLS